jgi:hypothetical protein
MDIDYITIHHARSSVKEFYIIIVIIVYIVLYHCFRLKFCFLFVTCYKLVTLWQNLSKIFQVSAFIIAFPYLLVSYLPENSILISLKMDLCRATFHR